MGKVWLLTKKNLKLLVRAKSSALVVVFAPLMIMLILGLAFNTSDKYGLTIGVYSASATEDTNSFLDALKNDQFNVITYDSSIEQCVEDIKIGAAHTCINLPASFAIEDNKPKEITFYVDPSRINLVWMIQETLNNKLNLKSQQISQQLTTDLLTKLTDTKTKIETEGEKLAAAKEKSTAAAGSSDSLKASFGGLDLTVPTTTYDLEAPTKFKNNISAILTNGKTSVSDAKKTVDSASINSSIKASINAQLALADDIFTGAINLVTTDTEGNSFAAVSTLVQNLQTDAESTKTKLATASDTITSGVSTLADISTKLSEGSSSIDSVQTTLNEVKTNIDSQKVTEASVIASPLITKIERINADKTYLNYLLPALLVIVIMFSSLLLGTTLVMMEKNSPAFTRNFFLPIKRITFILATYLTNLIMIAIQVAVIVVISLFFLKDVINALPYVALILFVAASLFTFIGMAIGYLFLSEETAVLASISTGSLLMFISGVILPLESMPPLLREITSYNPFVIAEKLIRQVFIFQADLTVIWIDFLILVGYAMMLFLIILIIESFLHQHLVEHFLKHHHKKQRIEQKEVKW
ncbi:TPA: ABC transporter permease [Candidatus Woesearchaeota archaeon]|nr:ABC transporter permease [Candidatus Woesearchaeota archaeon]